MGPRQQAHVTRGKRNRTPDRVMVLWARFPLVLCLCGSSSAGYSHFPKTPSHGNCACAQTEPSVTRPFRDSSKKKSYGGKCLGPFCCRLQSYPESAAKRTQALPKTSLLSTNASCFSSALLSVRFRAARKSPLPLVLSAQTRGIDARSSHRFMPEGTSSRWTFIQCFPPMFPARFLGCSFATGSVVIHGCNPSSFPFGPWMQRMRKEGSWLPAPHFPVQGRAKPFPRDSTPCHPFSPSTPTSRTDGFHVPASPGAGPTPSARANLFLSFR